MADQPDDGVDGVRRGDIGAVLARVGVALGAFLLVQLVCRAAGWDPSWYGVLTGFAAYLGYDRLTVRRRERAGSPEAGPRRPGGGPGPAR